MKLFPYVTEALYLAQAATIRDRDREIARLETDLHVLRESTHGAEISHGRELLKLRDTLSNSERTAATAVAMTAEKQKEIASLRGQINDILAAHKEQVERLDRRSEQLMDWIAKGYSGVPIFEKQSAPNLELPVPQTAATEPNPDPGVESDMHEAMRIAGPKARNIVRHLTRNKDENFNAEQMLVRDTFRKDKTAGEADAVAKTA